MMTSHSLLTVALGLALGAAPALAQYAPPPPPRPFPGFMNENLRSRDPYLAVWDVGGSFRLRYESKQGAGFTDAGSNWDFSDRPQDDTENAYLLYRLMPRAGFTGKWFAATLEGRSSYSYGDERYASAAPGQGLTERDGALDLHQAFVMVGNHKEFPLSLKVGRQELAYGDQRLVGHFRWNNNARTFDALKLRYQSAPFGVDVFTGGVVTNDHRNGNAANFQDLFSGAYFNFPSLAKNEIVESYLYARNVARGIVTDDWSGVPAPFRFPAPQDTYTAGLRIRSKPLAYGAWDYGIEALYQFGNKTAVFPATPVAAALTAPRLDLKAYALVLQAGYTWSDLTSQPRFSLIYSYGSGDRNPTDGSVGTFQNLFPTNHLFYGYMDLSSLQNLHDLRLAYTLKPRANVSVAFEVHFQALATSDDFWYNVAGVPRNFAGAAAGSGRGYRINPTYSRVLGQELDVVVGWAFAPSGQLEVGLSHYFRGDYIKESLSSVGSKDANYAYVQTNFNF